LRRRLFIRTGRVALSATVAVVLLWSAPARGATHFRAADIYADGPHVAELAVADYDLDGAMDIAGGEWPLSIFYGDGDGGLATPEFIDAAFPDSIGLAAADLNADGAPDLVTANPAAGSVSVLLNDGGAGFEPEVEFAAGDNPADVAAADFDGDASIDLVVSSPEAEVVRVLTGDGDGGFGTPTAYAAGNSPTDLAHGDFNEDGRQDIVAANYGSGMVSVLLGQEPAGGTWFAPRAGRYVGGSPTAVEAADVDGDGNLDIAVANGDVVLLRGDGAGNFETPITRELGDSTFDLSSGHFDTVPGRDVVVTTDSSVLIFGYGGWVVFWTISGNLPIGDGAPLPWYAAAVELDGDGETDVVLGTSSDLRVMLGDPLKLSGFALFAAQTIGNVGPEVSATLTNRGTRPYTVEGAVIEGTGADQFELSTDGCAGKILQPTEECALGVRFQPSSVGTANATLAVPTEVGTRLVSFSAEGGGMLEFLPEPVQFSASVGLSQRWYISVKSRSASGVPLGQASIDGPDTASFRVAGDACSGRTLQGVTDACELQVDFKPRREGAHQARLTLAHAAPGGPYSVELNGHAAPFRAPLIRPRPPASPALPPPEADRRVGAVLRSRLAEALSHWRKIGGGAARRRGFAVTRLRLGAGAVTLQLRTASGNRLVARGSQVLRARETTSVRARVTKLGSRLLGRRRTLRVVARIVYRPLDDSGAVSARSRFALKR
jgi:hypothetical protein